MSYVSGMFVPEIGLVVFGGSSGFNQTQKLKMIAGAWTIGAPILNFDLNFCTVQVMKRKIENNIFIV